MDRPDDIIESRCQLGLTIKHLREENRLSQKKFGLMIGLDRSYISRIESGRCSMTFDTLLLIASGFGITPSELLAGIGQASLVDEPSPVPLSVPQQRKPLYFSTRF